MKSRILFLLLLIYSCNYSAQISNADKKQLLKIIGEDFILLPNQKSYPYCGYSDSFKVDMSTSILNDTVGVSFHNEHLLWHDLISFCGEEEVLKLAKPSYVTVEEYLEFQNWVRDSIAREHIYLNEAGRTSGYWNREWTDDDAKDWINYQDLYWDKNTREYIEFDPSDRSLGRTLFNLNWDRPLNFNDAKIIPLIADMYYPQPERINKIRDFDERRLFYRYKNYFYNDPHGHFDTLLQQFPFQKIIQKNEILYHNEFFITEWVATLCDSYNWVQNSIFERDEFSVLGHVYTKLLPLSPIIINNPQAKAFCHWKQQMIQNEFDKNKIPYTIRITLPMIHDLNKLNLNESTFDIQNYNYTEQWQITNKEYGLFVSAIQDSILREKLMENIKNETEAVKLVNSKNVYFDEGTLEYTEFDPSDLRLARSLFNLNYNVKFNSFKGEINRLIDSLKKTKEYNDPIYYYRSIDSKEKSNVGLFGPEYKGGIKMYLSTPPHPITGNPIGKDLDLSFINIFNESTSVRSHENFQRFFIYNRTKILPQSQSIGNPDSLIQSITYEQAIAFYYWKYPIHNPNPKDDWQKFVLPSKEQFEAVQSGKQVIVPEKKVAYPTPLFRYVVHVYPK